MASLVTLAALLDAAASADGGSSLSIIEASPAADLLAGLASWTFPSNSCMACSHSSIALFGKDVAVVYRGGLCWRAPDALAPIGDKYCASSVISTQFRELSQGSFASAPRRPAVLFDQV